MWFEFKAKANEDTWEMCPVIQKEIDKLLPDEDFITYSILSEIDEKGVFFMVYCLGEDCFFGEDGVTELEGEELSEAEKENEIDVFRWYLIMKPTVGKLIKDCWINNGSQFGCRPSIAEATIHFNNLKKEYEANRITGA